MINIAKGKRLTIGAIIDAKESTLKNKTGEWRIKKPIIDQSKCKKCGLCYQYCPEGAIYEENEVFMINYDYCKGCSICENECPVKAIEMILERK